MRRRRTFFFFFSVSNGGRVLFFVPARHTSSERPVMYPVGKYGLD